jgi:hypothetical protein
MRWHALTAAYERTGGTLQRCATQHVLDWLVASPSRGLTDPDLISIEEWDALIAHAVAHTVAPQLFQRLSSGPRTVPVQVLKGSFAAMMWQKQQTSRLERDLSAVLQVLNAAGIKPILLKGAHLATAVYPDLSHRPMSDLDLLLEFDQVEPAARALRSVGFTMPHAKPIAEWSKRAKDITASKDDFLPVELHWSIVDPRFHVCIDHNGLRQRAREVACFGQSARVLAIEDLLLHICFHAAIPHEFDEKGLRPLLDVCAIVEKFHDSLDWSAVVDRAHAWRISRCTYLVLELARRHGQAAIPGHVLSRLKPAEVHPAVLEAARLEIFDPPGGRTRVSPRSVALAWRHPRALWDLVFAPASLNDPTIVASVRKYTSNYAGFIWHSLWRDRQRLAAAWKSMRAHIVLNRWLAQEQGGPEH